MENVEQEATNLGWVPQDHFKGDQEKWIDAETFVKRGKEILPILRKNNESLQDKVTSLETQLAHFRAVVEDSQASMEAMKELQVSTVKEQVKRARQEILAGLKQAKTDGDVDAEVQLQEQLQEVNGQLKTLDTPEGKKPEAKPAPQQIDPFTAAWMSENSWFEKDPALTGLAMGLAQQIKQDITTAGLTGKAFYNKLDEKLAEYLPSRRNAPSKVEGARGSGGAGGGSGGKAYNDLPAEAKKEAEKDARRFVGEGKAFKTLGEWQVHFAKLYFAGDEE